MVSKILGGGSKTQTATTSNEPPAYLVPYLQDLAVKSQGAYNTFTGGNLNNPYAGDRVADKTAYDTQGQQMAISAANAGSGTPQMTYNLAAGLNNKINSGGYAAPGNMAYDVKDNNYVQDKIMTSVDPILRNFQERLLPQLKDAAIDRGAYGGTKSSVATSQLARDTQQQVADIATQIAYQNFNDTRGLEQADLSQRRNLLQNGLSQELQATSMVPSLNSAGTKQGLDLAGVYSGVGEQERSFAQADIDALIQKYQESQMAPFMGLDTYASLLYGTAGAAGGTTTSKAPNPNYTSPGQDALQTAALAYSIFSDARLKENIRLEGQKRGFNIYSWNYIWDKTTRYLGVIAQEVEKICPAAVKNHLGFKAVDYTKLGLTMEIV